MNLVPITFASELRTQLDACVAENRLTIPSDVIERLVSIGRYLHSLQLEITPMPFSPEPPEGLDWRYRDQWKRKAAEYEAEDRRLRTDMPPLRDQAIVDCLLGYLRHWPGTAAGPFRVKYSSAVNIAQVSWDLMSPLRNEQLQEVAAFKPVLSVFNQNAINAGKRQLKRQMDGPIFPGEYEGPRERIVDTYFTGTPFKELLEVTVPIPFPDEPRFETHWILGEQGTGKSTFLSHLIDYDLKRVKHGTSVIIMDSQGVKGLAQKVAKSPLFEPGGELEGRLIYISPRNYTLALNPFKLKRHTEDYINAAVALIEYAVGGVEDSGMTRMQAGLFREILYKLFSKQKASLPVLQKTIEDAKDLPQQSKEGIIIRLKGLRSKKSVDRMLTAKENKLDLEDALASGKVICIDADNGFFRDKAITESFGKLFIALVLQATQARSDQPEHLLNPVFFYIDEAQDFIKNDPKASDIIYQARKQLVGMVIANHNDVQIKDPDVKEALRGSRIHSRCVRKGLAQHRLRESESSLELDIKPYTFTQSAAWSETLRRQAKQYGTGTPHVDNVPPELAERVK